MYDTNRDLIDALAAGPDALEGLLAGVDDDLARRARGGDEGWSVVEVVCHLRDSEERAWQRMRSIRDEDEPRITAYDQEVWAIERDYAGDDLRTAIHAFSGHRAAHVAALQALTRAAWARTGTHEEWGRITIENHTIHVATHDVQHLAQIARALARPSGHVTWPPDRPLRGHAARAATPDDAAAIARIYSEGIDDRIATFETRPRTAADVAAWFDGRHPMIVVEDADGIVVGFAATSEYRPRAAYAGVAEFSVYVARSARRQGIGRLAMEALLEAAEGAALWKLVSRVFVENQPSRRLLADLGFREVGVYRRHGRLDGRWRDVVIVERLLPQALEDTPPGA